MDDEGSPTPSDDPVERLERLANDALAVTVGLGILGINRVQVLRRDLEAKLAERTDGGSGTDSGDNAENNAEDNAEPDPQDR